MADQTDASSLLLSNLSFWLLSYFRNYSPDSFDDMEKHFTCPGSFDWFQGEYKVKNLILG